MKYSKLIFPAMFAVLAGCVQAIDTYGVRDFNAIPKVEYTAYRYSSGTGERLRAVFLKSADSDIEIIPYSIQITTGKATPEEARAFMERGSHFRNIVYQGVTYKGKPIGYLFTYGYHSFSRDLIEIHLFERDGKVYFSVWEKKGE